MRSLKKARTSLLLLLATLASAQTIGNAYHLGNSGLTAVVQVKNGGGEIVGWDFQNVSAATYCSVQIFDVATSPTPGTTQEKFDVGMDKEGAGNSHSTLAGIRIPFANGLWIAATTAVHGSSTCGTGVVGALFYH